ncbi:MAG TPA: TIGR03621 family F420-dependent LLM class oxidoreductase [Candidatus Binataceae bacterium]|nr:TIGR03621 family F420-dependent LLM class oxidoreductase [Candidatus Binataceae bacterium]
MEYGIQIANMEPSRFKDVAQAAEALGYDLVCFPDHIVMEGPERSYDPRGKSYDTIVIAAMLAEATKKIRLGHLVLCNLFRHPAITAQSLMTLDHISGGRLLAGLGTGWTETEFQMTGIPFPPIGERLKMLDEALTCIRSLWTNERTTFSGQYYKFTDAILWPKPIQQPHPPIIVGGGGNGLLRVAAKHADYVNLIPPTGKKGRISMQNIKRMTNEVFREKTAFVRAEAKRNGRDPSHIKMSNVTFTVSLTDSREQTRQMAERMGQIFGMDPDVILQSPTALIGSDEECIAELKRRAKDWGVSQFIFGSLGGTDEKQLRRLREKVLAHV